jgi:hypothetical protein
MVRVVVLPNATPQWNPLEWRMRRTTILLCRALSARFLKSTGMHFERRQCKAFKEHSERNDDDASREVAVSRTTARTMGSCKSDVWDTSSPGPGPPKQREFGSILDTDSGSQAQTTVNLQHHPDPVLFTPINKIDR